MWRKKKKDDNRKNNRWLDNVSCNITITDPIISEEKELYKLIRNVWEVKVEWYLYGKDKSVNIFCKTNNDCYIPDIFASDIDHKYRFEFTINDYKHIIDKRIVVKVWWVVIIDEYGFHRSLEECISSTYNYVLTLCEKEARAMWANYIYDKDCIQ